MSDLLSKAGDVVIGDEKHARAYFRPMKGQSQSHLLLAGEELYVVKFLQNPQSPLVLANEWLATRLAFEIGLPVPNPCVVHVSESFLASNPIFSVRGGAPVAPYNAGRHFGSRYIGGLLRDQPVDYPSAALLDRLQDPLVFAGALAFDKWVCNADGRQCVFLETHSDSLYSTYLIDHGNCFGLTWEFVDAPLKGTYGRKSVYAQLTGRKSFEPWISRIEALRVETIESAAHTIPTEWYGESVVAITDLVKLLANRRSRVWDLIQAARLASPSSFPLWE